MSSSAGSPHRFSGTYDSFYNDASAAAAAVGTSNKMHVPKRIRVTGTLLAIKKTAEHVFFYIYLCVLIYVN